jgi:hypothetical protein
LGPEVPRPQGSLCLPPESEGRLGFVSVCLSYIKECSDNENIYGEDGTAISLSELELALKDMPDAQATMHEAVDALFLADRKLSGSRDAMQALSISEDKESVRSLLLMAVKNA